MRAFKPLNV